MKYWFLICFCLISFSGFSQSQVNWLTVEEAEELYKKQPRPIFVDTYTSWCGWCKKMDYSTFRDPNVVNFLNNRFYPIKLNAETKDTIVSEGKTYINSGTLPRSLHDLAKKWLEKPRPSFPTLIFFDKNKRKSLVPTYMDAKSFLPLLVYFAEEVHMASSYDQFKKYYELTFNPAHQDTTWEEGEVQWYSLEEALALQKKKPKKILINFDVNWVNTSIMMKTTFKQKEIASYLNEKYYPVNLDATTRDTLNVFGQKFTNNGKHPSFHTLPTAMLENKMDFPALVFFNEDAKLVNKVQYYTTPEQLEPILKYYGENKHLNVKWPEFKRDFKSSL